MHIAQLVRQLGRNDIRIIGRDRFLLGMLGFVVYLGVALRYLLPWLNTYLAQQKLLPSTRISLSLADTYPMLMGYFVFFQGALMAGVIFGFMLLDERDHKTIKAMLVTPVPLQHYIAYRVAVPALIGCCIVLVLMPFVGVAQVPLWQLFLLALGAGLTASIGALFFATFASNKVQGFAITKFTGIAGWVIIFAWFVSGPWQWLFGLFPPFWISKAYWMALAGQGTWWLALVVGVVTQLGLIALLVRRFQKIAYL